ncbi:hypothetical protein FE257_000452 [Aspergillus nanangensis]|uniref:Large ribosomal subunit protein bL21m n=1 Tax=Aspergillus nanangensis TaxID=2582783 RepID=A0AAD4CW23_ASPNN|nr:hypothetical protein FE257_000452 [Aspergillus nanangensis]
MFSRTALSRAFALPLEQQTARRSASLFTTTGLRNTSTTSTTTSTPNSPNPSESLSATPTQQQSHLFSKTPTSSSSSLDLPITKQPVAPTFSSPLKVTQALIDKLPYLASQKPHYISAHLHDRPYMLTAGDQLRLPFLMPKVKSGDVLRLNRASVLGSRDFTLKGVPYVDERLFECRVRVMGFESEPLRVKEKTKRRQRHVRKVRSKHRYTVLKVMDVKVKSAEEVLQEGAVVVEEAEAVGSEVDVNKA